MSNYIRRIRRNMTEELGKDRLEFGTYGKRPAISKEDDPMKHSSFTKEINRQLNEEEFAKKMWSKKW